MMGRWGLALALVLGFRAGAVAAPAVSARAALVMDATSGEVLWELNGSRPLPPASTTKVLTAILALESGRLDEIFQVSADAARTAPSKIHLRAGQRMRLRSLLYALLLNSANDAAEVIAQGLAGSDRAFAAHMTERAHELGAQTAQFKNPHGLTEPGHVASARDLALILRHGLRLPFLREILLTQRFRVPIEAPQTRWISPHSHNRLLTGYEYRVIGKTGYTRAARRCFVGAARSGEREILIVLLGSGDLWGDAKRLFAWGFGAQPERPPVVMANAVPPPGPSQPEAVSEGDEEEEPAEVLPTKGTRWAVQVGPYTSRGDAAAARARLRERGYSATLAGRSVRLGSFATAARAQRFARRLRSSGYRGTVIAVGPRTRVAAR